MRGNQSTVADTPIDFFLSSQQQRMPQQIQPDVARRPTIPRPRRGRNHHGNFHQMRQLEGGRNDEKWGRQGQAICVESIRNRIRRGHAAWGLGPVFARAIAAIRLMVEGPGIYAEKMRRACGGQNQPDDQQHQKGSQANCHRKIDTAFLCFHKSANRGLPESPRQAIPGA